MYAGQFPIFYTDLEKNNLEVCSCWGGGHRTITIKFVTQGEIHTLGASINLPKTSP